MLNVLMGVAVLSLPFSMASSGFLVGTFLLLAYCSTAAYTAKLLGKCLSYGRPNAGPGKGVRPRTLQGRDSAQTAAFGMGARTFIATLFSFELFAAATACVVLLADSLVALWPSLDETTVKVVATALVLFPTTLPRSLAILSYASIIGVVSMLNLIAILFFNGLSTTETPGSLWNPAPTSVLPSAWSSVPLAVGLFVCSVDAHAIFPGIFSDMAEPAEQFPKAINRSYTFLFFCYVAVASAGYLCFGSGTLPEITQNFAQVASYNQIFNRLTIFLVAINPACKFALILGPVNYNIEYSFHQWFPNTVDSPLTHTSSIGSIPIRFTTSALVLIVSLLFPRFSQILAIMGAACSSIICLIFPVLCFWRIRAKVAAMGVDPGAVTWFDVVAGTAAVFFGALTFVVGSYGAIMHH
ncbi:transmembrane amino acid transporter protein-domain-containing protein [Cladochytrium replicatum]|nr:transmembrane amino acid transporter protein-domain-containing protein [Cladochytrium replicatum]